MSFAISSNLESLLNCLTKKVLKQLENAADRSFDFIVRDSFLLLTVILRESNVFEVCVGFSV